MSHMRHKLYYLWMAGNEHCPGGQRMEFLQGCDFGFSFRSWLALPGLDASQAAKGP